MAISPDLDGKAPLVAEESAGDNAPPFSVSEISAALKRTVEGQFGHVRIRGEISGYKAAASGHVYLALKDDNALIDGVMWRGNAGRLAFRPEDGLEVIVTGKLTTYPGRSKYQIVIESMELAGEGALMILFEKLKARLREEGLFDADRKRAIPLLPRVIGVVTSPTGAVIRDILHRLADRCPVHVIVWPVKVQGEGAAQEIASAINGLSAIDGQGSVARPDLIIVARGGGSIEDLWSFNEEIVVRAIAAASVPVISAVGHETDTTLADFAADLRAPTPTAAAEMAVPVRAEYLATLGEQGVRMGRATARTLSLAQERLATQARLLPALADLLRPHQQRLDEMSERLRQGLQRQLATAGQALARVEGRLRVGLLHDALRAGMQRLDAIWRLAGQLHPLKPLERGYAKVSTRAGEVVTNSAIARKAGALDLAFADGVVPVTVDGASASTLSKTPAKPTSRIKNTPDDRQRNLL
ncbi:MAG: exodeoxyribonuclease VII large subunit [Parasphingorhabdus sp.]|nr:exodeoxyribonuclease VII large subunit [Parasphingorhabdus sp.]